MKCDSNQLGYEIKNRGIRLPENVFLRMVKEDKVMSKIIDYSFLFQSMFGTKSNRGIVNPLKVSSLSSGSVQAQLKAAGINTNSAQYKAAIKEMTKHAGSSGMFTNVQAIKNLMSQYDKDGDYIDPTTGLAGLLVTEENATSRKTLISIPESSLDDMFELTKKEFLQENGMGNGDTTKRSDVYTALYRKTSKNDRLKAGYTLSQYEKAYTQAFISAVKAADPTWTAGHRIPSGALDGITRESVESQLVKSGNTLVKRSSVSGSSIDLQI